MSKALVLGAGASRGVEYATRHHTVAPLDGDFFDQVRRLIKLRSDRRAVIARVLKSVRELPQTHRRSLEKAFYTLHLRAKIGRAICGDDTTTEDEVVADFLSVIQLVLARAHSDRSCTFHRRLIGSLSPTDAIVTFNYDLVADRTLALLSSQVRAPYGKWSYGLAEVPLDYALPVLLKLHGSTNWELTNENVLALRTNAWDEFSFKASVYDTPDFALLLPYWDKRVEEPPWADLWRKAFEHLARTKFLVVWGYSLPITDLKAEAVFLRAFGSTEDLALAVIDPCAATHDRWKSIAPYASYWTYESAEQFMKEPPDWYQLVA